MVSSRKALFLRKPFSVHLLLSLILRSLDRCGGNDFGFTVNDVLADFQLQGYSSTASEVRAAVNDLSQEGHIYSTIDEEHFQNSY